ncbi:hypothetical protein CDL12_10272 [Handroanthus impetiginosus]|uniref:Uncharacterized protein n=1 Tax=Handroanthus impetiginosus TaxID=429701 RepID=A0A2G9FYJ7_9LAMI|nr:hypothetical protein CDL12_29376 [Handroanthus impetiginosus]PIN17080.1 hypothetical protein CDL12_10272 [Handroanthus impetiginosus]
MAEKETQPEEAPQKELLSAPNGGTENMPGKLTWPKVVGLTTEEAERKIKEEMPDGTSIQIVSPDSFLTMDYRTDRVRIFIDSSGKVSKPPKIG